MQFQKNNNKNFLILKLRVYKDILVLKCFYIFKCIYRKGNIIEFEILNLFILWKKLKKKFIFNISYLM